MTRTKLLSVSQTAQLIGCDSGEVRRLADRGELKSIRLGAGAHRRFDFQEVQSYLTSRGIQQPFIPGYATCVVFSQNQELCTVIRAQFPEHQLRLLSSGTLIDFGWRLHANRPQFLLIDFADRKDAMSALVGGRLLIPIVKVVVLVYEDELLSAEQFAGLGAALVLKQPFEPQSLVDFLQKSLPP